MKTSYLTIREFCQAEITEKKSRFVASAFPARNEEEALAALEKTRKAHPRANHNCYAWRILGGPAVSERYSDDGEPGQTAGMPILNVIAAKDLLNVLVVVTRYFGGILLGAGGLARAYSSAAALVLEDASIIEYKTYARLSVAVPYEYYAKTEKALREAGCVIQGAVFAAGVEIEVFAEAARAGPGVLAAATEASNGRAEISPGETVSGYIDKDKLIF